MATIKYRVDGNFHIYLRYTKDNSIEEIPVKSCSISEEDLRIKSAKISTYKEIDLSNEMTWIYITYMDNTIYSGVLLDGDYDESTGMYSYQTLGHQRWLTSKTWYVHNVQETDQEDLYKAIENIIEKIKSNTSIGDVLIQPKEKYMTYPNNDDNWDLKEGLFYEDKTYYEILMSLVGKSNHAIDCYVDDYNILHLDPINIDSWKNDDTIQLIPSDLTNYDYKSNATNIITGIYIKTYDIFKEHVVTEPDFYSSKDMIDIDLTLYYGRMETFEKLETDQVLVNTEEEKVINEETGETTTEVKQKKEKVIDVEKNERKARNKITSSLRDLMSFTIELNKYIPQLHTNMFIWFVVPKKHTLANYQKFVAKIDQTTVRGGEYVLNRFYVEKVDIDYSDSNIKTKITINPFASDMSEHAKAYDDAKKAYESANCSSESEQVGSTTDTRGGSTSAPPPEAGTITVNHMPSTAGSMPPYSYKRYTKTWRNWCPVCGKANTLVDNPKGVHEGEITCSMKLGGCDADWDGVTGKNKAGNCPNPGCKYNWTFLVDATGKRNSKGNIDMSVGGSKGTSSSSASNNCVSGAITGSYDVASNVASLANSLTSSTNEIQICKDLQRGTHNSIGYTRYCCFCKTATQVAQIRRANCGDGTRLQLEMTAYKGVAQSKLKYVHISGHYYAEYNGTAMDWCGGGVWGHHWGSGALLKKTQFPTLPTDGCCGACGDGYEEEYEGVYEYNIYDYKNILNNDFALPMTKKIFENDFAYLTIDQLIENGYKSNNEYLKEWEENQESYEVIDFDDIDKVINNEYRKL